MLWVLYRAWAPDALFPDWPRGGVVTQRTANPRTPVRFRAWPPILAQSRKPNFELPYLGLARRRRGARLGFIVLPVAMPPHGELTTPAADDGNVDREHEKPERDHPEAEHRQEPKQAQGDEQDAEPDADQLRFWQMPMAVEDADFMGHARVGRSQRGGGHRGFRPHPQPAK